MTDSKSTISYVCNLRKYKIVASIQSNNGDLTAMYGLGENRVSWTRRGEKGVEIFLIFNF